MAPAPTQQVFIRLKSQAGDWFADPSLRPKLAVDAVERQSSLADVITRILSAHYKVDAETAGRRSQPAGDGDVIKVHLPMPLYRAIVVAASRYPRSKQEEILHVLSGHYGLRVPARSRAARRPRRVL